MHCRTKTQFATIPVLPDTLVWDQNWDPKSEAKCKKTLRKWNQESQRKTGKFWWAHLQMGSHYLRRRIQPLHTSWCFFFFELAIKMHMLQSPDFNCFWDRCTTNWQRIEHRLFRNACELIRTTSRSERTCIIGIYLLGTHTPHTQTPLPSLPKTYMFQTHFVLSFFLG